MSEVNETELTEEEQNYFDNQRETEEVVEQDEETGVKAAETEEPVEEEPDVVPKDKYDAIHQAMDRERHEKRELKERLEQLEIQAAEERARWEERMKSYGLMEEEEVDPTQEINQNLQKTQKELEELREQARQNQITNHINQQESQFSSKTPDYEKAKQHYLNSRLSAFKSFGYEDEQAQQMVFQEISQLVGNAMQKDVNAAEKLYEAAKANGYVPVTQKGEQKLKVIESGQKSSSMPKGSAPKGDLTAEAIANMSQKEFDALPEEELLKVLGA